MRATIVTSGSRLLLSSFFLGAFSICWLCVGAVVLIERQALSPGSPLLTLALKGLGNFGPTLSALGVTAFFLGSRKVRSWITLAGRSGLVCRCPAAAFHHAHGRSGACRCFTARGNFCPLGRASTNPGGPPESGCGTTWGRVWLARF